MNTWQQICPKEESQINKGISIVNEEQEHAKRIAIVGKYELSVW